MIYKLSSSKEVISKVYRDLNLQEEDRWMDMIEWIGEAMDHIQLPYSLKPVVDWTLEVIDFKAPLPCDLVELKGLIYKGAPLPYMFGIYDTNITNSDPHLNPNTDPNSHRGQNIKTWSPGYVINPGWINTNFRNGILKISYLALHTDEDGFPMIPDETSFKEACYRYILTKLYYPKFISGQIDKGVYMDMRNEWTWYCGQAGAKGLMPNLDQMEGIKRAMLSLVPNVNKYSSFFRDIPAGSKSRYTNF